MDTKIVEDIRQNWANKTSDELLQIWKENDRERWSESAFEAARQILIDRGVELPQQDPVKETKTQLKRVKLKHPIFLGLGWLLCIVFFVNNVAPYMTGNLLYSLGSLLPVIVLAFIIYRVSFRR